VNSAGTAAALQSFIAACSWGATGGYLPTAASKEDDDDDDDDTTTTTTAETSSTTSSRKLVEVFPSGGDTIPPIAMLIILGALAIHIICNIVFFCLYTFRIKKRDEAFAKWLTLHKYAGCFVPTFSLLFSFHFARLFFVRYCGIKGTYAVFSKKDRMYTPIIRLSYVHIFCVCFPLIAAFVLLLIHFPWSNIEWMLALDSLVVTVLLVIYILLDICRMERELNYEEAENKLGLTSRKDEEIADIINLFPTV
jgi:hypothetical protein